MQYDFRRYWHLNIKHDEFSSVWIKLKMNNWRLYGYIKEDIMSCGSL